MRLFSSFLGGSGGSLPILTPNSVVVTDGTGNLTTNSILPVSLGGTGTDDRTLVTSVLNVSVDWENQVLYSYGVEIFNWAYVIIKNSGENYEYDLELAKFTDLNLSRTMVDFANGQLWSTNYNQISIDYLNGFLNDNNGLTTVEYFNKLLYGDLGFSVLDWQNCLLTFNSDTVLDWQSCYLAYQGGTSIEFGSNRKLYATATNSYRETLDFDNCYLRNTTGSNSYMLNWSLDYLYIYDGIDLDIQTTTGTKIGRSTSAKIGFHNASPTAQLTTSVASATFSSPGSGTNIKTDDTFDGLTLQQVVRGLRIKGFFA